jgi:hypothetical protein
MNVKSLLSNWSLPDCTAERSQLTLRLSFNDYARLHALKAIYPTRSVNDLICDILKIGLDEIVDNLPARTLSQDEAVAEGFFDDYGRPLDGIIVGLRVDFDSAYRNILISKQQESNKESKQDEVV